MKKGLLVVIVLLSLFLVMGCAGKTHPTLTLQPSFGGVRVSEGFAVSFTGDAIAEGLPQGYHLPRQLLIYKISNPGETYSILVGSSELPAPHQTVTVSLSEEIKVTLQEEGLTQILFK